ncbi:MAG: SixA phosphatase family protein [Pseudonocardiaceae bacterium]
MTATSRTLILLRHAKSAWPDGTPDIERPLARRGRRDAPAVGQWLRRQAPPIDLVVCSPALRARQTWDLVTAQLNAEPRVRHDERLYGTSADVFLQVTRELPDEACTALLVAHNPSLEDLLELLTGADEILRTSALAVLSTTHPWTQADPGSWTLEALATPRGE